MALVLHLVANPRSEFCCTKVYKMSYLAGFESLVGYLMGLLSATSIFVFWMSAMKHQAFLKGEEVVDLKILGTTMYTCFLWVVNYQLLISINYFRSLLHFFIWTTIVVWYIFLLAFGAMDPNISTTAYKVFIETCALATSYWLLMLFVLISSLIPYFTYASIHQMIHWIIADGQ